MKWFWEQPQKSFADCDKLIHDTILNNDFHCEDLQNFSSRRETGLMDKGLAKDTNYWHESDISISVPDGCSHRRDDEGPSPTFTIRGLMHRSLTEII